MCGFQGVFCLRVTEYHDSLHFLAAFLSLVFWVTKAKGHFGGQNLHHSLHKVFTKGHFRPTWISAELVTKKNWSFFSVHLECQTQDGFNVEEEGGEELDLGLLLLPGLDGVEEPHGVEQPHRHVAPFLLLPVHLQQK